MSIFASCGYSKKNIYVRKQDPLTTQYQNLLKNLEENGLLIKTSEPKEQSVNEVLRAGKKNVILLEKINSELPEQRQIQFPNNFGESFGDYDSYWSYGAKDVHQTFQKIKKTIPLKFHNIFFDKLSQDHLDIIKNDLNSFIKWSRLIDKLSQQSVRWRSVIYPHKDYYTKQISKDMRSYLSLKNYGRHFRESDNSPRTLEDDLTNFADISTQQQKELKILLIDICLNDENSNKNQCKQELDQSINSDEILNYYSKYNKKAEDVYQSYFNIKNINNNIQTSSTSKIQLYFQQTNDLEFYENFKLIVKDFWGVSIQPSTDATDPKILIKKDIIPNVSNNRKIISWNQNYDLKSNYGRQVMAHEFGHIIGFPDCYVEFFDAEKDEAIFYFLNRDNIMCNSLGSITQDHIDQMNKNYRKI